MLDLDGVFETDRTRRPDARRVWAEGWSLLTYRPAPPDVADLPNGEGRPVLVVPAFLTNDDLTRSMRRFLEACGFRAFGWGLGINWGPTPRLLDGLAARVEELCAEHGPVALVGISLGGLLARNLAFDRPADIAHVVTVASPFRLPTSTTIEPLFRLLAHGYEPTLQFARLGQTLPVPSTSIYTPDDGIVAWESCRTDTAGDCIEVEGAHVTLASNPATLRAIVQRLAGATAPSPNSAVP